MPGNKLIFKDAEKARDEITIKQKREIRKLYNEWANEINDRAKYYKHKTNSSSYVSERQMKELKKMMQQTSRNVSKEIQGIIKNNMYLVSDSVVRCNKKWLESVGFKNSQKIDATFNYVPDSIVRNLITGQIYESGWSLSSRIWSDNNQTLKDVYRIVAKGVAENTSIYDISKQLEKYVRPNAKLPWNKMMKDGVRIYKKQVDYNAQRLARTLVQHSYQQSFVAVTKDNPFITDYIWLANGSRACPLCRDRGQQHFSKNDLPMDHPNGQCTMVPNVVDNMVDQLANWVNSPNGTYPDIDRFAIKFGYTPE